MRKVLLVDDELLVVESIKKNINWNRCGVDAVFLCDNAADAKRIVKEEHISLLISDIEMPGTNGIGLVSDLRKEGLELPVIFLTGFAEFEYARAAVSLRAEEYILKPVDYIQLEEKIGQILRVAKPEQEDFAKKESPIVQNGEGFEDFVRYVEASCQSMDISHLGDVLTGYHLDFSSDDYYVLFLMHFSPTMEKNWERAQNLRTMLIDRYTQMNARVYISGVMERKLIACVRFKSATDVDMNAIRETLLGIMNDGSMADKALDCCCFVTERLELAQIGPMIRKLIERDEKNVIYQNRIILVGTRNISTEKNTVDIDYMHWGLLLSSGEFQKLRVAVDFAVHSVVINGDMDAEFLRNIYNNFMQIMYHYIGENHKLRNWVASDIGFEEQQKKALNSVQDFRAFSGYFINLLAQGAIYASEKDVSDTVKKYIDEHLSEKISRTEIAELVSLSENYLSRFFHKENGCSITDYIMQKRLSVAKKLLLQTKLPVSVIGEQVGYETTTYFIRIFKRETGMTPKDYRKSRTV